jgi:hypothetical protein
MTFQVPAFFVADAAASVALFAGEPAFVARVAVLVAPLGRDASCAVIFPPTLLTGAVPEMVGAGFAKIVACLPPFPSWLPGSAPPVGPGTPGPRPGPDPWGGCPTGGFPPGGFPPGPPGPSRPQEPPGPQGGRGLLGIVVDPVSRSIWVTEDGEMLDTCVGVAAVQEDAPVHDKDVYRDSRYGVTGLWFDEFLVDNVEESWVVAPLQLRAVGDQAKVYKILACAEAASCAIDNLQVI